MPRIFLFFIEIAEFHFVPKSIGMGGVFWNCSNSTLQSKDNCLVYGFAIAHVMKIGACRVVLQENEKNLLISFSNFLWFNFLSLFFIFLKSNIRKYSSAQTKTVNRCSILCMQTVFSILNFWYPPLSFWKRSIIITPFQAALFGHQSQSSHNSMVDSHVVGQGQPAYFDGGQPQDDFDTLFENDGGQYDDQVSLKISNRSLPLLLSIFVGA